jgi:hypothetical protein
VRKENTTMNQHAEEQIETIGTVVFLQFNTGTKSEGKVPFLYIDRDTVYKLVLKGDNPFENRGFVPFDGKRVRVTGVKKENIKKEYAAGTLIADSVVPEEKTEGPSGSEEPPSPGFQTEQN